MRWAPLAATVAMTLVASPSVAQDIEAVARMRGVPLPAAYYAQIERDSTSFTFARALRARAARAGGGVQGSARIPVVLALFNDSPAPTITRDEVSAVLFDGPAPRGTLTEAYLEMSRGALLVGGDVFDWVRTSVSLADAVGASSGLGTDGLEGEYFAEALDSLDGAVDFALYDNDGPDGVPDSGDDDGFVDVITFEYLEVAASCGGPGIWPHRWTLHTRLGAPYETNDVGIDGDTIRIDDYITQGVTDCSGTAAQDASTMAHEFGHALGLPDYYHWIDSSLGPRGRRWVLGCWSLMAAGSWGCGPVVEPAGVFGPTHLTAHSKEQLGWVEYVEPGEVWNEDVFLDPVETSGVALRVPLDDSGRQFLIAEYRDQVGFDQELPAAGVIMYKLDLDASRAPHPASSDPYYLTLLEQDADSSLLRTDAEGGNRGDAGDAWGVGGTTGELNALTTPALTLSDGAATSVTVHEVSVVGGRAHLVISTSPTPRLIALADSAQTDSLVSFLESVRVAGGVMPYVASAVLPTGLSVVADGDGLSVSGSPPSSGSTDAYVWVRDARGTTSEPLVWSASAPATWTLNEGRALGPFLVPGLQPLTSGEVAYLDAVGNANGTYDVGDLRRWLRTHPTQ